jgi:NAD(P)-dependent dehydrogenase (short-subunit alcohol dehydrogenase family)
MSKVWFVTGSSRGLGRALVEVALEAGDRVATTARNPERLQDLLDKYGDAVLLLRLEVTDYDAAARVVAQAEETFGRIDVVVNNAGYSDLGSFEDTTIDSFRTQIDTNFYGVVNVSKAAVPVLHEQGQWSHFPDLLAQCPLVRPAILGSPPHLAHLAPSPRLACILPRPDGRYRRRWR